MSKLKKDGEFKIGILGSYGGMNLGDEAILQSIISQLKRSVNCKITVFSFDPADTLNRHKIENSVNIKKMNKEDLLPEITHLDLLILGGGGILFDEWVKNYFWIPATAQENGIPVMVYAVSSGPLTDPVAIDSVSKVLNNAAEITVREAGAKHMLEQIGVSKPIKVTADPALLLEKDPLPYETLKKEGLNKEKTLIGISVREPGPAAPDIDVNHYHNLLASAADFMVLRFDADVVFVPMEPKALDMQHSHAVISQMQYPQRAIVLKGSYTSGQVLSIVKYFSFVVGMRLHFLIFAALNHVPFVALPYATKVSGFIDQLDIEMPPMSNVKVGHLLAYIDRSWDLRQNLKHHISKNLPNLQSQSLLNNRIATELLKSLKKNKKTISRTKKQK